MVFITITVLLGPCYKHYIHYKSVERFANSTDSGVLADVDYRSNSLIPFNKKFD
jgi:hypothetical protein